MSDSPSPHKATDNLASLALVLLQFVLMAVIAWRAGPSFLALQASALAWVVLAAGIALGVWAVSANRPGNFNIRPLPKAGGQLVRNGPYAYIRHPMYASILLGALALVLDTPSPLRWAIWGVLLVDLIVKLTYEETLLVAHHPEYAALQQRTKRLAPFIY